MAFQLFKNTTRFNAAGYGTADFVVASAASGAQTPEQANVADGKTYRYYAQSPDGSQFEMGSGTYTVLTHTLSRTTIEGSSNSDALVYFTVAPIVDVFASSSATLEPPFVQYTTQALTAAQRSQARSNLGMATGHVLGQVGTQTPAAGEVGEVISTIRLYASRVFLTNGVNANIVNISLTPGDWNFSGYINFESTGAPLTSLTTSFTDYGDIQQTYGGALNSNATNTSSILTPTQALITATTVINLIAYSSWSGGTAPTVAAWGKITARRTT